MPARRRVVVPVVIALSLAGAGCGSSPAAPSGSPAPNGNPTIVSMTVTPLSVLGVTSTQFSATATDPDNDPLTYGWSYSGQTATGATVSVTLPSEGSIVVTLTVSDGKGGTATDTRTALVVSVTGSWQIVAANCADPGEQPGIATITQTGTSVTGSATFTTSWCKGDIKAGSVLHIGGTVDAAGHIKTGIYYPNNPNYDELWLDTMLDSTGKTATGNISYWLYFDDAKVYGLTGVAGSMVKK